MALTKRGVTFFNLLQKERGNQKGGVPPEKGDSNPGGSYAGKRAKNSPK